MSSRTVLHYQLAGKIGGGGNGIVWKAHDTLLERPVALKFLQNASEDPSSHERFIREARAASALNHPNIVTIYEINSDGGQPFIAMELVEGRSLAEVRRDHQRLPPGLIADYAVQLCNGLGAAHRAGIVHRDIKPSNVMLTPDGVIKILDFGLAKASARESGSVEGAGPLADPLSIAGTVVGTVPYMSPEQASGDPVGPRSDVFSVGILLYEMLSGLRPFQGSTNAEIMQALLSADPAPLSSLVPDVPEPLARIVHKCLQKSPDARYRDAAEIAAQIRTLDRTSWPRSKFDETTITIGAKRRGWSGLLTRANVLAGTGFLVLAVASIGGYKWWPFAKEASPSRSAAAALAQTEALQRAQAHLQRYDRKGNVDSAIALLEAASHRAGASAAVYASLAEAYVRKYNESTDKQWLTKAVESGRQAVRITDDLAAGHTALGMALAASGQRPEAVAEFERAIGLNPLSGPAHLGLAGLRTGKEAEQLYQKAAALSPGNWIPLNQLAACYYRDARYDEGVATWRKALGFADDNVILMANIAAGLHKNGRYAEAADALQGALRLDESNPLTWANLGTARYFQGRYLDAARAMQKAVDLAPGRYLYWGNLGDSYRWAEGKKHLTGGAYRKAIELLREQIKLEPNNRALRSILAAYLAKSGEISHALTELSQIGELSESDPLFKATMVYELAGNRTKALGALERAIRAGVSMHEVTNEPELALLRSDPRFTRMTTFSGPPRKN